MEYLVTAPELLATTAADVGEIRSAIIDANASAVGPTGGLVPAANDEVSEAIANVFGGYGQQYQALLTKAAAFHDNFTHALAAAGNTYTQAEAASVEALGTSIQTLLGRTPTGGGSSGTSALISVVRTSVATEVALVMGGTANPSPDLGYLERSAQAYLLPHFPALQLSNVFSQFTPEQFWPVTPQLGGLTFEQSVAQGVSLLDSGINTQLGPGKQRRRFRLLPERDDRHRGNQALMAPADQLPSSQLSFVLAGDPNNPDGGLLERFTGFYIPIPECAVQRRDPAEFSLPDHIYTIQYDGIADAPQYPLNVVSDLNAFLGYFIVHSNYPIPDAPRLPTPCIWRRRPATPAHPVLQVMTQNLPLIQFIRDIPYAGPPIADIFQPDLRVLVDLGYGDIGPGYELCEYSDPRLAALDPQRGQGRHRSGPRGRAGTVVGRGGHCGRVWIHAGHVVVPGRLPIPSVPGSAPAHLPGPAQYDRAVQVVRRSRERARADSAEPLRIKPS